MTEKEKKLHRSYQSIKRDLKKGSAEPFLFLIRCLENGWRAGVEELLNYIKNKNYNVYEELYKGIKYRLEAEE